MDFITGLPMVQGKDCIHVVVDRLTKFFHFFSIPTRYATTKVANLFFREVFKLHGLPKNIVSDRDNIFMGGFWQELFRLVGTKLTPSTNYHPQTDDQTERVNQWLEGYLRNYVTGQQRTWIRWLHLGNRIPKAKDWVQEIQDILKALKDNLVTTQNKRKLRVGEVAYELELPSGSRIHNVFHVSCLKKVLGQQVTVVTDLPPLDDEGHLMLEPEANLESKERRSRSRTIREFLVRWKNLPDEDAT
eukprot:PITA_18915